MNREEAIAIIRKEYLCVDRDCDIERNCGKCDLMMPSKEPILEAYKMAIKALEQMPVITTTGEGGVIYYPQVEGVTPTVVDAGKQEPSGDAVDRKLVCAFIAGLISDDVEREKGLEYIRNMPPVNPQPCEDAISRAEAVRVASGYCHPANVAKELAKLPAVTPQPKTGHWIDIMVGDMPAQACDQCNTFYPLAYTGGGHKYCPNCGCRMVEPQESEDKQ